MNNRLIINNTMKYTIAKTKTERAVSYVPPTAESYQMELNTSVLTVSTKDVVEEHMGW